VLKGVDPFNAHQRTHLPLLYAVHPIDGVPCASIVWLARAVKLVRPAHPAAPALTAACSAKSGRLRVTLGLISLGWKCVLTECSLRGGPPPRLSRRPVHQLGTLEPNLDAGEVKIKPPQELLIAFATAGVVISGWRLGHCIAST